MRSPGHGKPGGRGKRMTAPMQRAGLQQKDHVGPGHQIGNRQRAHEEGELGHLRSPQGNGDAEISREGRRMSLRTCFIEGMLVAYHAMNVMNWVS